MVCLVWLPASFEGKRLTVSDNSVHLKLGGLLTKYFCLNCDHLPPLFVLPIRNKNDSMFTFDWTANHIIVAASCMSCSTRPLVSVSWRKITKIAEWHYRVIWYDFIPTCWIRAVVNWEANIPNVFVMAQSNTQHDASKGSLTEASLLQPEEWLNNSLPLPDLQLDPTMYECVCVVICLLVEQ